MWGDQLGPVVARALRLAESEERRAEREYQEAAEGMTEQRRARSITQFLEERPEWERAEWEGRFRADMLRGVEPGLTPSERCALVAGQMDAADREQTRLRSQQLSEARELRRARLMTGQVVARSHQEILAIAAMDFGETQ